MRVYSKCRQQKGQLVFERPEHMSKRADAGACQELWHQMCWDMAQPAGCGAQQQAQSCVHQSIWHQEPAANRRCHSEHAMHTKLSRIVAMSFCGTQHGVLSKLDVVALHRQGALELC